MRFALLFVFTLFYAFGVHSGVPIDICETKKVNFQNSPSISWYSSSKNISLKQAQQQTFSKFADQDHTFMNHWMKFKLQNTCADTTTVFLQNWYSEKMTIYLFEDNWLVDTLTTGYLVPEKKLSNRTNYAHTPITLAPDSYYEVLIKSANIFEFPTPERWGFNSTETTYKHQAERQKESRINEWFTLFFIGVVLSICAFVFVLWWFLKERAYLNYCVYLMGLYGYAVIGLSNYGVLNQFIAVKPSLRFQLNEPLIFFSYSFYSFFVYYLFDRSKYSKKLFQLIKFNGTWMLVYALSFLIFALVAYDPKIAAVLEGLARLLSMPLGLFILVWLVREVKSPMMKWLLVGNTFFYIMTIVAVYLNGIEDVENNSIFSSRAAFLLGMLWEVVFFTIALGSKFKKEQSDKFSARGRLIQQLKLNEELMQNMNEELEKQVKERSDQLIGMQKELDTRKLQQVETEYEKKLTEAHLATLMLQMNPHFIFNSLNSIQSMIVKNDHEKATKALSKFSKLTRKVLSASREDFVSLAEELEMLKLYIDIERTRFDERFFFAVTVDDSIDTEEIEFPPLLLQPFVENAIWHGLLHSDQQNKKLLINATREQDNMIRFEIIDNGIGREQSLKLKERSTRTRKSYGTQIVSDRVELINKNYPVHIKIAASDLDAGSENTGTKITVFYKLEEL